MLVLIRTYVRSFGLALLTLLCATAAESQSNGDRPITDLVAQRLDISLSLSGSLAGLGSSAGVLGESVVWRESDASSVSWNPAALGFLKRRSVVVDWIPGLQQNVQSFYDVDGIIEEEMDAILDEYGTVGSEVAYPSLTAEAGLGSSIGGFGVAIPFILADRSFGFGFAYAAPMSLALEVAGSGFEAGIKSEQKIQDELKCITMRTWLDLVGDLGIRVSQYQCGIGADLGGGTAIGIALSRVRVRSVCRAYARIDGILEMSGSEYIYNDPNDPHIDFASGEQNELSQSLYADYFGSGWGLKLGAVKKISRHLQIGLTVSVAPAFTFSGTDSSVNNTIPFIRAETNGDTGIDEFIDPTRINLAKLTETTRIVKYNYFTPTLRMPDAYSIGLLWGGGKTSLALRYTKYDGEFSLGVKRDEIRGLQIKHGVGLGFDVYYAYLGASAFIGDEILPANGTGAPLVNLIVPRINLGFRIPLQPHFWVDGLIGVEPTPLLRFTFRYGF